MDLKAHTDILQAKLELRFQREFELEELAPYLEQLIRHPGSAIIIGIELRGGDLRVGRAWLNPTERNALRRGLERVNAARAKRNQPLTSEEEKSSEAPGNPD